METIVIVAVFLILSRLFRKQLPKIIGNGGERLVSWNLDELGKDEYKVLNNMYLQSQGNTYGTQIDHVVISRFGVFVIETKGHGGWIFGNANDEKWTEVVYHKKYRFYNPLRQNYAHLKAVEMIVKPRFSNLPVIGFVVFPSARKLQVTGSNFVGNTRDIVNKIREYKTPFISGVERDEIYQAIVDKNITNDELRAGHTQQVQLLKATRENK